MFKLTLWQFQIIALLVEHGEYINGYKLVDHFYGEALSGMERAELLRAIGRGDWIAADEGVVYVISEMSEEIKNLE